MRVLVTGSSGLIGRQIVSDLASAGMEIVAIVRRPEQLPPAGYGGVQVIANIGPETNWDAALNGVDAVIHLAAQVHDMAAERTGRTHRYHDVNALGTEQLAAAAARSGVQRFVFVSSIKAMGGGRRQPWTISDEPRPLDPYGKSKLEGERRLLATAAGTEMQPVIVRPPLVYGPGVKANFLSMMRWVRRGWPLPLGSVEGRRSLMNVWNLSALVVHCLEHPNAAGGTFLASDGNDVTVPELLLALGRAMNRPVRLIDVPVPLLRLVGRLPQLGPALTRLTEDLRIDASPTFSRLGWTPPVPVEEGLRRTVEWFTTSGQST